MSVPTLLELAESGAHYGHHRSFVYPKAKEFVYSVRRNIALIDLVKTQDQIEMAQKIFNQTVDKGQTVMFVGTKRGVRDVVRVVAESVGAAYVTERWLGGFLSNFETISTNIKKMNELDEFLASDESKKLTKIERIRQSNKLKRYHRFLAGVTELKARPDLLIMASASQDKIALREAAGLGIPIIAICDTDTNPESVDYPIPANDDAPKAVELILQALVSMPNTKKTVKSAPDKTVADEPFAIESTTDETAVVSAEPAVEVKPKKAAAKKSAVKKVTKAKK